MDSPRVGTDPESYFTEYTVEHEDRSKDKIQDKIR